MDTKKEYVSDNSILMKEWDNSKNAAEGLDPSKLTVGSSKKAWWICSHGHSYQASINKRNRTGCPYCTNRSILVGYNDLKSGFPTIAAEWHPSLNGDLSAEDVFPKSRKKVWWQCGRCGYEWQAYVYSRTGQGTKCPRCSSNKTSFPEQVIFYFIRKFFPKAINRFTAYGFELDIFIPEKASGIEYDGFLYHASTKKDNDKDDLCLKYGIQLFRIREHGLYPTKSAINYIRENYSDSSLENALKELLNDLGVTNTKDVDIDKYRSEIMNLYYEAELDGSVADLFPELIKEWHPSKNGNMTPEKCKARSGRKVWWKCSKCGGEYQAIVAQRTSGHGCPFCSGHKALAGATDLQTVHPELAAEWHPQKNGSLTPKMVKPQSNKKVWWLCPVCNNEWEAYIYSRIAGRGCPYCAGQRVIVGKNDLQTFNPQLATEWHPTKNGDLSPKDVMASSGKKVWWLCPVCHNEWQATIASRNKGNGCSLCGLKKSAQAKMKPVVQMTKDNTIVARYESVNAARDATGAKSIYACCKHKLKSSGGFIWRYAEEVKE